MHPAIIITFTALSVALIALEACGFYLIVRDTKRRSGKWGINRRLVICPCCRSRQSFFRIPTSWHQGLWGGWTCKSCGREMDKWGEEIPSSERSRREDVVD
jgi:hypothetical protein